MPRPTDDKYRALVQNWIEAGQEVVTSADALYELLRYTDFYAPRSIVREVWGETVAAKSYIPLINRLPEEQNIPRSMTQSTTWDYSEPYAVKVKVTGIMGEEGEIPEHYVTLLYAAAPTRGQIGEDYAGMLEWSNIKYVPESLQYNISAVYHKKGSPW